MFGSFGDMFGEEEDDGFLSGDFGFTSFLDEGHNWDAGLLSDNALRPLATGPWVEQAVPESGIRAEGLAVSVGEKKTKKRAAWGTGPESKANHQHPLDDTIPEDTVTYKEFFAMSGGKVPVFEVMKHLLMQVDRELKRQSRTNPAVRPWKCVDRDAKRRMPVFYGWLEREWDVIGGPMIAKFREYLSRGQ